MALVNHFRHDYFLDRQPAPCVAREKPAPCVAREGVGGEGGGEGGSGQGGDARAAAARAAARVAFVNHVDTMKIIDEELLV